MSSEEIKQYLASVYPQAVFTDDSKEFVTAVIDKADLLTVAKRLKDDAKTQMDFLFCQTAVDFTTHLEVVYHLSSTNYRHNVVLKVKLEDRATPEVTSVYDLWQAAEYYENEIYDLMGIRFTNHPELRRIFLGDEWKGYPLRKDYKDEVNVVTL